MRQPATGNNPAMAEPGDFMMLRYEYNETGWTISPVDASPALEGLYRGPVWLFHGDALQFTAWGPNIDNAWTTRVEKAEREIERLREVLGAAESALEASQDEVRSLNDALARMATGR